MPKCLAEVPAVQEKFQTGGYGNQPVVVHKGLAAKMIAMAKKVLLSKKKQTQL